MRDLTELINALTLEEKASLCSGLNYWYLKGVDRLGIPSIMVTDGPHGLRKQATDSTQVSLSQSIPATCFPTASALAATWDRELVYQVGRALGEECRQEKVGVILGPGINIKRSPLCGRNFEYFSEDPYLAGEMAKGHIQGVQSQGIGTSLKHYAANNQEYRRMTIDAIVDERALREIYLAGFEIAVKEAQPWTVMGAYNKLNGTYCCENPYLLTQVLREEWGFQGLVVTDWGAMNEVVDAIHAGLDLEMPGTKNGNAEKLVAAVRSGKLDLRILDRAVERILSLIFKAQAGLQEDFRYDPDLHHTLARQVAAEGAVLLKNLDRALPLQKHLRIALLGNFAKNPRYQGAGSSSMNPTRLDDLFTEMVKLAGPENIAFSPGYTQKGSIVDEALLAEAVETARSADAVVICAGLPDIFEVEGVDRQHLRLPDSHNLLIERVAAIHPRVIVVLSNGAPVEMPWVEKVHAILEGYLGGQAGAGGLADLLYGLANPCGKLAETFPFRLEDNPSYFNFPGGPLTVEYRESLYVGYRFYNSVGKEVLFPFGHGLSYTSFSYSHLELSSTQATDQDHLYVRVKVKNTGDFPGKEIVQLYIQPSNPTAFRPKMELKGFEKVTLAPGEDTTVKFALDPRAFAYYHTGLQDWYIEPGEYLLLVGASSQDIRLEGVVSIISTRPGIPAQEKDQLAAYKSFSPESTVSQADFEKLLGRPLPANTYSKGEQYTLNTCIADMKHSFFGRLLLNYMKSQVQKMIKDDPDSPTSQMIRAMVHETPPRLLLMTGTVTREMVDGVMDLINGKILPGLWRLAKAMRRKK